ncbi:MAG: DNA topoisomerase VI subunit B [Candidatus Nanoarchaeia archaeon]|nr:DNA topoisomerase VI subunit B [Candidatus Nanoarchaeia archaeon]
MAQTKLVDDKGEVKQGRIIADELATKQREISVSEFFLKNRHLLGFDNPKKALLTAVKEAVDNSLDACEEAKIAPELKIIIESSGEDRYKVMIEDNGPGIVKEQVGRVFGKLLYGSKFHRLKCSRGQQGIGISAAAMYGQLTTGKPIKIWTKISPKRPAMYFELFIDTRKNEPNITKHEDAEWNEKEHGVKLEIELEAKYAKGKQSVDDYLKQVAIANPHCHILYINPEKEIMEFPSVTKQAPKEPKEIKPHPYGVELGMLMKMLKDTKASRVSSFLQTEFCRVSPAVSKEICTKAMVDEGIKPMKVEPHEVEALYKAIQGTKIMSPPTDCLVPIGEDALVKGLKKEVAAEFYTAITRPPAVYRGNPFQIEVGLAFGGSLETDELVKVMRFANRVPLLYQQGACASYGATVGTMWRNYGLSQSKGALPAGPALILVHMSSVWVPFTSEAKEAIASYPEIMHEMKLALQEVGRQLGIYIRKNIRAKEQKERASLFENYIPELADSVARLSGEKKTELIASLQKMLKKSMPEILREAAGEQK